MHIFYTPDISADVYILNEEESKHCVRVLRLEKGSLIQLVDGQRTWAVLQSRPSAADTVAFLKQCSSNIKTNVRVIISVDNWEFYDSSWAIMEPYTNPTAHLLLYDCPGFRKNSPVCKTV